MEAKRKQKVKLEQDVSKVVSKSIYEIPIPSEYIKPMADMMRRFVETNLGSAAACGPYAIAIAIAVVIVVSNESIEEMVINPKEKRALKFAVEQIRANPEQVRKVTGIELTEPHLKLMEVLAR
ncbi:MAG: hypothetical protein GQ565_01970 [Candidatus Aegiribacteria sp.]|nr:hypothetical protein [Candidatus Aegiribacteria sp.]